MCTSKLGQRVVTRWISKRVKGGRGIYCADGVNVGACAPRSHTSIVSIVGFAKSVSSSAAAGARGALLVTVARGPEPHPTRGVARKSSSNFSQP